MPARMQTLRHNRPFGLLLFATLCIGLYFLASTSPTISTSFGAHAQQQQHQRRHIQLQQVRRQQQQQITPLSQSQSQSELSSPSPSPSVLAPAPANSSSSSGPPSSNAFPSIVASDLPAGKVATAWFASWHVADFSVGSIDWSKYTDVTYAFAVTTPNESVSLQPSDEELLPQFVDAAHRHNVKASLSIGGWTGSRYFSTHVATPANRTAFVRSVIAAVQKYDLDGVDFDWEYPGRQGMGCNVFSATDDTPNYLLFLQELRASLPPALGNLTISGATTTIPFFTFTSNSNSNSNSTSTFNSTSSPPPETTTTPTTANMTAFAHVFDHIAIMNYDLLSPRLSTAVGPHSPLDDSCAPPQAPRLGSARSAVSAWTAAGMPADKIVLGVPAYGHSYTVTNANALVAAGTGTGAGAGTALELAQYPVFEPGVKRIGDRWDGPGGLDVCGNVQGPGGVYSYWGLLEEGFLVPDGSGAVAEPNVGRFDECSQTPFVYNPTSQVMVAYEDPRSFAVKGAFIKTEGLRGFAMWEAGGDYKNVLLASILNATIHANPLARPNDDDGPSASTVQDSSAAKAKSTLVRMCPLVYCVVGCCIFLCVLLVN